MRFSSEVYDHLRRVCRVRQWYGAKLVQHGKGWCIEFTNADKKTLRTETHSSRVALASWLKGAASMCATVEAARHEADDAKAARDAKVSESYADHETSDLVKELRDRADQGDASFLTDAFWTYMTPTKEQVAEFLKDGMFTPLDVFESEWLEATHASRDAEDILAEAAHVVFATSDGSRDYAMSRLRDELRRLNIHAAH